MRLHHLVLALATNLALSPVGQPAIADETYAAYQQGEPEAFSEVELVAAGRHLFSVASEELALVVQEAVRRWGEPNGYILGEEASGAVLGGLRYGRGVLHIRTVGQNRIFWQGPSLGLDAGADGARTMMLVYKAPTIEALYARFVGLNGSAYLVGGFGLTAAMSDGMVVVPIRTGIGARLGVNVGYLKFTPEPTWNPF